MDPMRQPRRNREAYGTAGRAVREMQQRGGPFVEAVEATRMPMLVADPQAAGNPIVYANPAFLQLCGHGREEVLGRNYLRFLGERADPEVARRVEAAMAARREITEEVPFRAGDGREVRVSMFVSPMAEDGRVVRHFASFLDLGGRAAARGRDPRGAEAAPDRRVAARTRRLERANARLAEEVEWRRRTEALLRDALAQDQEVIRLRDLLVRAVNHRTGNALQLAASLLGVQSRHVDDPACRAALETAMGRLRRLAEVHALLSHRGGGSPEAIDFPGYLRRLCREVAAGAAPAPGRVALEVEAEEEATWAPDLVVPLGLIAGEALTNALRHAFPDGREGRVRVSLGRDEGGAMRLRVEDDGVGMPAGRREGSLGLRLVEMLARQVKGEAVVEVGPGGGTAVTVAFPDPEPGPAPG